MKTLTFTFFLFGTSLAFQSCKEESSKIGFLLPNFIDSRYVKDRDYFTDKVKQLGSIVEVRNANNDPSLQFEQAKELIDKGVKVIVITAVNQNLAAEIVRYAHEKGVKVIAYERLIQNCQLDYFVGFDHYLVGKQQAEYALQKKPSGNYVLLEGDKADKNAEMILKGQMDQLNTYTKSGKVKIIYHTFVEDWSGDGARCEMSRIINLSGEKIDVVLTANDGMAEGAITALDELQPGYPVIVTGLDADLEACKRVVRGKQSMTVFKSFRKEAEMVAELSMKIQNGQKGIHFDAETFNGNAKVPTILLQSVPVDRMNMKATIVSGGFYSARQLEM